MKSRFVNLTNRLGSYNWITNKHLKSMSLGGRGVILFFFFGGGSEEEDQDEKLPANLSTTGKKERRQTSHKAKKKMDKWREKNPSLFHHLLLSFRQNFS